MKKLFIGALAALLLSSAQIDRQPVLVSAIAAKTEIQQQGCIKEETLPKGPLPPKDVPNSTYLSTGLPPLRYQGDQTMRIIFVSPEEADRQCTGYGKPICGYTFYACAYSDNKVYMPNSCHAKYKGQPYADLMCHEKGHVNGWPGYHGD